MGLIAAALGSAGGVLADQWKEYFYCEAIPNDVLVVKGQKKVSSRSTNTKGSDNIITTGSVIAVADGQCMIIVEQGKVVDFCATPGEYTYDARTEPSLFSGGGLAGNIKEVFMQIGKRFTFGGEVPMDQRVYYVNTKEIIGNKYGTPSPVPFRVVDERAGIDIDIGMKCFGEYSYKITNPILLYTNVVGNVAYDYKKSELEGQMRSELLTALQPAFAKISDMGIRYSSITGHTSDIRDALKSELSVLWGEARGIEIYQFGVSQIKADEEDEKMIKDLQRNAAFMDPTRAAAAMVGAQTQAMQSAANNTAGAMTGFMGMGMAMQAGNINAQSLYQMGAQQQAQQPAPAPAPQAAAQPVADGWKCACGNMASGKFCPECGSPKPADDGWTCACGVVNKGKFCAECGKPKPAGALLYKCDKCGWEPEDPANPPKFCPECGDPFDEGDIVK